MLLLNFNNLSAQGHTYTWNGTSWSCSRTNGPNCLSNPFSETNYNWYGSKVIINADLTSPSNWTLSGDWEIEINNGASTTIQGDLTVNASDGITLSDLNVTGDITIQGGATVTLEGDISANNLNSSNGTANIVNGNVNIANTATFGGGSILSGTGNLTWGTLSISNGGGLSCAGNTFMSVPDVENLVAPATAINLTDCSVPGTSLPVELLSFYFENNTTETATLSWDVGEEIDIEHYTVENSTDGINFDAIELVYADNIGFTTYTSSTHYKENPSNYYRLKVTESDLTISYSNLLFTNINTNRLFSAYPNTLEFGINTIHITTPNTEKTSATISNSLGQIIESHILVDATNYEIELSSALSKGIYYLILQQNDTSKTLRLVIR